MIPELIPSHTGIITSMSGSLYSRTVWESLNIPGQTACAVIIVLIFVQKIKKACNLTRGKHVISQRRPKLYKYF